jgi:hypothetical protein
VLWNNPHPCVKNVSNSDNILSSFKDLQEQAQRNQGERLQSNCEWARINLNKTSILQNYIAEITK